MFAPFSWLSTRRRTAAEDDTAFVKTVRIAHPREPRSRRLERVLVVGWILILLKSAAVWWACHAYPQVPVNAWWIIAPTLAFASLCTLLYWRRD